MGGGESQAPADLVGGGENPKLTLRVRESETHRVEQRQGVSQRLPHDLPLSEVVGTCPSVVRSEYNDHRNTLDTKVMGIVKK